MMEISATQHRINRVQSLLDRLEAIPDELDKIDEELYWPDLTRRRFTELVTNRNNLLLEKENKEAELKTIYRSMKVEEEEF